MSKTKPTAPEAEKAEEKVVETPTVQKTPVSDNIYTYIGGGANSPQLINFMGMQEFMRGEPTEVTNPAVLKKIKNNQCFVKGNADKREMLDADRDALKREQRIAEDHKRIEAEIKRQYNKYK